MGLDNTKAIDNFFDLSNKVLLDKNYSLLQTGNKMDKLILDYVKKNDILIPIAPIEDRDGEYRIFTTEMEISKIKGIPYATECNSEEADPVKLLAAVSLIKDDVINKMK